MFKGTSLELYLRLRKISAPAKTMTARRGLVSTSLVPVPPAPHCWNGFVSVGCVGYGAAQTNPTRLTSRTTSPAFSHPCPPQRHLCTSRVTNTTANDSGQHVYLDLDAAASVATTQSVTKGLGSAQAIRKCTVASKVCLGPAPSPA
jgi:hypothetical protein